MAWERSPLHVAAKLPKSDVPRPAKDGDVKQLHAIYSMSWRLTRGGFGWPQICAAIEGMVEGWPGAHKVRVAPDTGLGVSATFAPACADPVSPSVGLESVKRRKPSTTRRLQRRELSRRSKAEKAQADEAAQVERQAAEDAVRLKKQQAEEAARVERQVAEDAERKKQQEAALAAKAAREAEQAIPETKAVQPDRVLLEFVEFGRTWTHVEYVDKNGHVLERRQCVERDGRTCGACGKDKYLYGVCVGCGYRWAEYEEHQDWQELDAAKAAGVDIYDVISARNKKRRKRAARAQKK